MGACICCYSEGAKVGKVLDAFPAQRASAAQDGMLQKIVGRVVLAGQNAFYAPVTGEPCVYFSTTVREERLEVHYYRDNNGHQRRRVVPVWYTIATSMQFSNFYIQDGTHKIFVPGSRGTCRIQSTKGGGTSGVFSGPPPPGVQAMIAHYFASRGQTFWGWGPLDGQRTGRYDYTEESFAVNEIVAALGVPISAVDPTTNQPCKVIQPFEQHTLTEEWMKENKWTLLQRKSWETLLEEGAAVLLSDNAKQTAGVPVAVIQNLPAYMTAVATAPDQFNGMYNQQQGAQPQAVAQPVNGAQPVTAQPVNAQPVNAQPVNAQPVNAQPVHAQPVNAQPVNAQPVNAQPVAEAKPAATAKVSPE